MPSILIRRAKLHGVSGECIWGVGIVGDTDLKNSKVPLAVKNPHINAGKERCGFDPWVWKIPWRRVW